MKIYMRPRYQCDFCGKRGGSKHHMQKHEDGCTKNPFRQCRMCRVMGHNQKTLEDMMRLLPNPDEFKREHTNDLGQSVGTYFEDLDKAVNVALPKLREFVNNCPACILAALRQRGIPVPIATGFNFTEECKALWTEFNETKLEECNCGY